MQLIFRKFVYDIKNIMVISKYASLLINIYEVEFIITFNYSRPSWILLFKDDRVQRVGCQGAACRMPGCSV